LTQKFMECPLFEKCKKKCGMSCEGRNFADCDFYKLLLKEAKIEKWKEQRRLWK